MFSNNYSVKSLKDYQPSSRVGGDDRLFFIENGEFHLGSYVTCREFIFVESLHENFNKRWLSYWLSQRGNTFGGIDALELKLNDDGSNILINKKPNKEIFHDYFGFIFQYTYDHNYHHFLMNALPKLAFYLNIRPSNTKVVVRSGTPNYQLEMIRHIIPDDELLFINPNDVNCFKGIFLSAFPTNESVEIIERFYSEFFVQKKPAVKNCLKKIFISRADSIGKRPQSNYVELSDLMALRGFSEIVASSLSLEKRLDVFGQAAIIAGVFSAGFANLVFVSNCKHIVFIEHPDFGIPHEYLEICRIRGVKVWVVKPNILSRVLHKFSLYFSTSPDEPSTNLKNNMSWRCNLFSVQRILDRLDET